MALSKISDNHMMEHHPPCDECRDRNRHPDAGRETVQDRIKRVLCTTLADMMRDINDIGLATRYQWLCVMLRYCCA